MTEGCDILDDKKLREDCEALHGPHSYRNWKDVNFRDLMNACENHAEDEMETYTCQKALLRGVRRVEDGRFADAMSEMHRFINALDMDERRTFKERHPALFEKVNQFGTVEEIGEIRT